MTQSARSISRRWPWIGEYECRLNTDACEDDRGGRTAWEVWHWPTDTVESDWFTATDAFAAAVDLHREQRR